VTHPYHPLFQQEFELVSYRQDWGEDRVWFQDKLGHLHSLPTSWTDAGAVDPFVAIAAGRSLFRVADLIELARQIDGWKSERVEKTERKICHDCKVNDVGSAVQTASCTGSVTYCELCFNFINHFLAEKT
jgi:hypothetical protein